MQKENTVGRWQSGVLMVYLLNTGLLLLSNYIFEYEPTNFLRRIACHNPNAVGPFGFGGLVRRPKLNGGCPFYVAFGR